LIESLYDDQNDNAARMCLLALIFNSWDNSTLCCKIPQTPRQFN